MKELFAKILNGYKELFSNIPILNEMSISRKLYIGRVSGLAPTLISHWGLVYYSRHMKKHSLEEHWLDEIYNYIEQILSLHIKKNQSHFNALKESFFDELDYDKTERIAKSIFFKFRVERINISENELTIIVESIKEKLPDLIQYIANHDSEKIIGFVDNI